MTVAPNGDIYTGHAIGLFGVYRSKAGSYRCDTLLRHRRSDDVNALAVNSKGHIIVGGVGSTLYDGGPFMISEDNGATWYPNDGEGGFPRFAAVYSFFVDRNDRIYAGTSRGTFRSSDNGRTWEELQFEWEFSEAVYTFALDSNYYLYAGSSGTSGGRVLRSRYPIYTIDNVPGTNTSSIAFHARPNPMHLDGTLHFRLATPTRVSLALYDIFARKVHTLIDNELMPAGPHTTPLNTGSLANGLYYARLQVDEAVYSERVALVP